MNLEEAEDTLKGKVKLVEGESQQLSFPDQSFDFVFAKGSIHHNTWEEIQQSFREVARVLREGGHFLFQCRSPKDPALINSKRITDVVGITAQDPNKEGANEHYFTEEEIRRLGKENGFEIVVGPEEIIKEDGNARFWVVFRKI
ncbi:MAG: class I SAM-dependent methyltransferase [bacterium]|nr:class I SAM-dependent methyltransferase [bacterium]